MDRNKKIEVLSGFTERDLGDEIVLMHSSGEVMHSFGESGIFLWNKVKEGPCFGELLHALLDEYDIDESTAGKDLEEFLQTLIEQEIIK